MLKEKFGDDFSPTGKNGGIGASAIVVPYSFREKAINSPVKSDVLSYDIVLSGGKYFEN